MIKQIDLTLVNLMCIWA